MPSAQVDSGFLLVAVPLGLLMIPVSCLMTLFEGLVESRLEEDLGNVSSLTMTCPREGFLEASSVLKEMAVKLSLSDETALELSDLWGEIFSSSVEIKDLCVFDRPRGLHLGGKTGPAVLGPNKPGEGVKA